MPRTRRRRILVLTPRDPYPVIGGDRLRIHRIARELAQRHDLTLLTFCESEARRDAPLPDDGVFTRVHRVVLPRWRSWLNVLRALPTDEPLQVAYYKSEAFRAAVQELAPEHDGVIAHLVRTAGYARDLKGVRVLEMTDAISMSMERIARTDLGYFDFRRLVYAVESRRLAVHERRAVADFDLVTLNSAVDHTYLFRDPQAGERHVIVAPNGVDPPADRPPPQASRVPGEIAFVGNLQSLQNFDAVWFFARHVLPLVRARRPDAVLRVIGFTPPRVARRLAALDGVRLEGFVPSLEGALATARVGVCAARISSGMQNKLLEYFANGLAVVCSGFALEGLDARVGEHLLLAETPDEWADQVVQLLEDPALAQRLADEGHDLVCRRYRWDRCVFPLLSRLDKLLDNRFQDPHATSPSTVDAQEQWTEPHALPSKSSAM